MLPINEFIPDRKDYQIQSFLDFSADYLHFNCNNQPLNASKLYIRLIIVWYILICKNTGLLWEIKFYNGLFAVDKNYDLLLRPQRSLLGDEIPKKSIVHSALITTCGIKNNEYRWAFNNVVTMDDLFAS